MIGAVTAILGAGGKFMVLGRIEMAANDPLVVKGAESETFAMSVSVYCLSVCPL